jgi:hypothetical protein
VTITNTSAVRVVGTVLLITPLPRTDHGTNTIDVVQTANSSTSTTGGPFIQVFVNGQLDTTQPATSSIDSIVVFGAKASDKITIDPSVTLDSTIDGGHGGHNKVTGGGGLTIEHGWFGFNVLVGGQGLNELIGRAGHVRFKPSSSTALIFTGDPSHQINRKRAHAPGGTFYVFKRGRLIPVPLSALYPQTSQATHITKSVSSDRVVRRATLHTPKK